MISRRSTSAHGSGGPTAASAVLTLPPAPAPPNFHIVLVNKPDSPQTALMAWGLGVPATRPEPADDRDHELHAGAARSARASI